MTARRRAESEGGPTSSMAARLLRTVLIAILVAFVFGLVVGTVLRRQLERPLRYMGSTAEAADSVARASHPGHVRYAAPRVLVTRQHEEQIG